MLGFLNIFGYFGGDKNAKGRKRTKTNKRTTRRRVRPERLPLDMKPSTPKTREQDKRAFWRSCIKTTAYLVAGGSLIQLGHTAVRETLFKNPHFTLQEVYVDTVGMLTPSQVIRATELVKGDNLLTLNLREVRERVEHLPAVKSAVVQRDFDAGKLTIVVTQRQPVAWLKCEPLHWLPHRVNQGLLVDVDGTAIPAQTLLPEFDKLPVIADDGIDQITVGRPITSPRFTTSLSLLQELQKRGKPCKGDKLASIRDITAKGRFSIVATFDDGAKVTFGTTDVTEQLKRYDAACSEARSKNWDIHELTLIGERVAPVSYTEEVPKNDVSEASERTSEPAPKPKATTSSGKSQRSSKVASTSVARRTSSTRH